MSGSPKYTYVTAAETRRQQAERERQERERRRREEEARQRAAALAEAQQSARGRFQAVADQIERLRQEAVTVGSELLGRVDQARSTLTQLEHAVNASRDAAAVSNALRRLEQLRRELTDLRADVLAPQRREVMARLQGLATMLDDIELSERFAVDPMGAEEVDRLLTDARRRIANDPIGSVDRVNRLAEAVTRHLGAVLAQRAAQEEQRREAERLVTELEHRLSTLINDANEVGVEFAEQHPIGAEVAQLAALVHAGQHADVVQQAGETAARIAAAESRLDTEIQGLTERRDLMRTIAAALPDLGFEADPSTLEETGDGALGLRAYRQRDGEEFAVVVAKSSEGTTEVAYTTGSMLRDGKGTETAAHHDLVGLIAALSEHTRRAGFTTGPIAWQPPGARRHGGVQGAQSRRRG